MDISALENNRAKIDEIDKQLAKLFTERMEVASAIAQFKIKENMPVFDAKREEVVLQSRAKLVDVSLQSYFQSFMKDVIDISKEYQCDLIKDGQLEKM